MTWERGLPGFSVCTVALATNGELAATQTVCVARPFPQLWGRGFSA